MFRRLPIESAQPLVVFAIARLAIVVAAFAAIVMLGFPYGGEGAAVIGAVGIPWAVGCLVLARRAPHLVLSPLVPAGDLAILLAIELVAPDTYGAVRTAALFLIAAHAHLQGEARGLTIAAIGSTALVAGTAIRDDSPLPSDVRVLYETVFIVASLATGVVVGRLRTAESASRLRARRLSRRALRLEGEFRRRVADAIHDGPVQELIGLNMILGSARKAAAEGRGDDATRLLDEARELTERNVGTLRDELIDLGPYAFEEIGFGTAIENCLPVWKRRYGVELLATIEEIQLPGEVAGDLFRIAQEAVVNAGKHAHAKAISLSLRSVGEELELRITDDGDGFGEADPLGPVEPGHLGLAMMRERAELLYGRLDITSSERGTRVIVRAPLTRPGE